MEMSANLAKELAVSLRKSPQFLKMSAVVRSTPRTHKKNEKISAA